MVGVVGDDRFISANMDGVEKEALVGCGGDGCLVRATKNFFGLVSCGALVLGSLAIFYETMRKRNKMGSAIGAWFQSFRLLFA